MRRLELKNQRFGRWTVLADAGSSRGASLWICVCDCGNFGSVIGNNLKTGVSKSCGCWQRESRVISNTTHGMTKHPLFSVWKSMKTRCYNKNVIAYDNYGAKGIVICDEWLDFKNFHRDMHKGYKQGLTIERLNVNLSYSKDNCIWIPKSEQSRNRSNTIWVETSFGKMSITEAANKAGVSWFCMYNRVVRKLTEDKLFLPAHKAGNKF